MKGDRLSRGIAAVALALAAVALVIAARAYSLVQESTDEVRRLTSSLEAALSRGHDERPSLPPPPHLDHEE